MFNTKSSEAPTNLALTDVDPVRDLVIDGKPLNLAGKIMNAADDVERTKLLTGAVHANAEALRIGVITDTRSNLNMRNIAAIDASDDNEHLLQALIALEESDPNGCQAVISSLSATTILTLAQPDTNLGALVVEKATTDQLVRVANRIAGDVFVSERRQREKNWPARNISDDPELNHSRQKAVRRKLGKFLDLVAETGDKPLENFALAITKYRHGPDEPSPLFDAIRQLAFKDGRESAIDVINALPDTIETTNIKIKLGLQE